jgi:hypothetical protein
MKKTLFKTVSILTLFLLLTNTSNAQISAGLNLGFMKPSSEGSDAHLGLNLSGKYDINEKFRVGANFGYYSKTYDFMGDELTSFIMPITGMFEYSFTENKFSPYIGADLGIYRIGISGNGASLSTSNFGMASTLGANYSLSDNFGINANVKYHLIFTEGESTSALGANLGVLYKF